MMAVHTIFYSELAEFLHITYKFETHNKGERFVESVLELALNGCEQNWGHKIRKPTSKTSKELLHNGTPTIILYNSAYNTRRIKWHLSKQTPLDKREKRLRVLKMNVPRDVLHSPPWPLKYRCNTCSGIIKTQLRVASSGLASSIRLKNYFGASILALFGTRMPRHLNMGRTPPLLQLPKLAFEQV